MIKNKYCVNKTEAYVKFLKVLLYGLSLLWIKDKNDTMN